MKIDSYAAKCLSITVTKDDICITDEIKNMGRGEPKRSSILSFFSLEVYN